MKQIQKLFAREGLKEHLDVIKRYGYEEPGWYYGRVRSIEARARMIAAINNYVGDYEGTTMTLTFSMIGHERSRGRCSCGFLSFQPGRRAEKCHCDESITRHRIRTQTIRLRLEKFRVADGRSDAAEESPGYARRDVTTVDRG